MTRPGRFTLTLVLIPIVALTVAGILADWFAPAIITQHPLLQIFLNPRNRYLVLAANRVDPAPYYLVGFFRLVLTDPLYFLLGLWYGDAGLRWMEKHMASPGTVAVVKRWFAKAAYPIVLVAPNGFVCLLAGAAGMGTAVFILLDATGTILRLIALRLFAAALESPLDALLRFIQRYQWWLVGVSVGLGLLQVILRRRQGRSEVETVGEIERELEDG